MRLVGWGIVVIEGLDLGEEEWIDRGLETAILP